MGEETNRMYDMYLVDNETGESFCMGTNLAIDKINYKEGESNEQ